MSSSQDDRAKRLEQLPDWEWAVSQDDRWNQKYEELLAYVADHGKLPVVSSGPLGRWVADQRQAYRDTCIIPERAQLLESVEGWMWAPSIVRWDQRYEELLSYVTDHGRLPLRSSGPLGNWVDNQRLAYRGQGTGKITQERISLLEQVPGWIWNASDGRWNQKYDELVGYVAEHGRLPMFSSGTLGFWINNQRTAYKGQSKARLTPERIQLLEQVPGWMWNVSDGRWSQRYEELVSYVAEHGKLPSGPLGTWISNQRRTYKGQGNGKLTPERIQLLEQIPGWWWTK